MKVTLARIRALSALHKLTEPIDDIQFPTKIRAVNNWTCNWTDEDDRQLIKSVLKYGVGVWEDVKADQDLKLTSKILPTSDDATPQVNRYYKSFASCRTLCKLQEAISQASILHGIFRREYLRQVNR